MGASSLVDPDLMLGRLKDLQATQSGILPAWLWKTTNCDLEKTNQCHSCDVADQHPIDLKRIVNQ
jgi:hypothetical protein